MSEKMLGGVEAILDKNKRNVSIILNIIFSLNTNSIKNNWGFCTLKIFIFNFLNIKHFPFITSLKNYFRRG